MDTSKSNEQRETYLCGASIFSGRRDPTWDIDQAQAAQLKALWDSLQPYSGTPPSAPPLGYRGAFFRDSSQREWNAYKGAVSLSAPEGSETRLDKNREFEKLVLSYAPEDAVPSQLLDEELTR